VKYITSTRKYEKYSGNSSLTENSMIGQWDDKMAEYYLAAVITFNEHNLQKRILIQNIIYTQLA
jgi:hypothetical protein